MFLGDGMSFSTIAATRMYLGGEEKKLSFEEFEYAGFSKVRSCCIIFNNLRVGVCKVLNFGQEL